MSPAYELEIMTAAESFFILINSFHTAIEIKEIIADKHGHTVETQELRLGARLLNDADNVYTMLQDKIPQLLLTIKNPETSSEAGAGAKKDQKITLLTHCLSHNIKKDLYILCHLADTVADVKNTIFQSPHTCVKPAHLIHNGKRLEDTDNVCSKTGMRDREIRAVFINRQEQERILIEHLNNLNHYFLEKKKEEDSGRNTRKTHMKNALDLVRTGKRDIQSFPHKSRSWSSNKFYDAYTPFKDFLDYCYTEIIQRVTQEFKFCWEAVPSPAPTSGGGSAGASGSPTPTSGGGSAGASGSPTPTSGGGSAGASGSPTPWHNNKAAPAPVAGAVRVYPTKHSGPSA